MTATELEDISDSECEALMNASKEAEEKCKKRERNDKQDDDRGSTKRQRTLQLTKIISGGQTGADRGALEAAEELGIPTGGTAPYGYATSNGKDPELGTRFHLTSLPHMPHQAMYVKRSCANVDNADATVAFRLTASVGTDMTIGYCRTGQWKECAKAIGPVYRPVFVVSSLDKSNEISLRLWLQENSFIRTLNVAGHRESSAPIRGFKDAVRKFLCKVLQTMM